MFTQDKQISTYLECKHKAYIDTMQIYFKLDKNIDDKFIRELRIGSYDLILSSMNENDFINDYIEFYKNKDL